MADTPCVLLFQQLLYQEALDVKEHLIYVWRNLRQLSGAENSRSTVAATLVIQLPCLYSRSKCHAVKLRLINSPTTTALLMALPMALSTTEGWLLSSSRAMAYVM